MLTDRAVWIFFSMPSILKLWNASLRHAFELLNLLRFWCNYRGMVKYYCLKLYENQCKYCFRILCNVMVPEVDIP